LNIECGPSINYSQLLAASRQTFAFARDGALPLSGWLYRMNHYTQTPVNTVIYVAFFSVLLGLLVFAGPSATNAIFSLSVVSLYVAYSIPIAARFLFKNDFKPGPFNLGSFVRCLLFLSVCCTCQLLNPQSMPVGVISVLWMMFMGIVFLFPPLPQTDVASMNYTVVVLGGTMLLSILWYYFPKYGGVHWFTGPVRTLDSPDSQSKASDSKQGKVNITVVHHVESVEEK
jgi:amino acid transporter